MGGFIFAIIVVAGVRSFAFRGTNSDRLAGDIGAVVFLTIVFKPDVLDQARHTLGCAF